MFSLLEVCDQRFQVFEFYIGAGNPGRVAPAKLFPTFCAELLSKTCSSEDQVDSSFPTDLKATTRQQENEEHGQGPSQENKESTTARPWNEM